MYSNGFVDRHIEKSIDRCPRLSSSHLRTPSPFFAPSSHRTSHIPPSCHPALSSPARTAQLGTLDPSTPRSPSISPSPQRVLLLPISPTLILRDPSHSHAKMWAYHLVLFWGKTMDVEESVHTHEQGHARSVKCIITHMPNHTQHRSLLVHEITRLYPTS